MLRAWKQAHAAAGGEAFPGEGKPSAQDEELRRLRAEVKRLTMGPGISNEAAASLARASS
jgi:transposase